MQCRGMPKDSEAMRALSGRIQNFCTRSRERNSAESNNAGRETEATAGDASEKEKRRRRDFEMRY